jgi:hypothetical protein
MERAEGRNRSEIPDLDARVLALDEELSDLEVSDRAFLFNVEAYAWVILLRLRAELFERRLGMPNSDTEVFSILQKAGLLDLAEARRLRQFCEARALSSRDLLKIDVPSIREMAVDRDWIRAILGRFKTNP